jgi:hypothetical protein
MEVILNMIVTYGAPFVITAIVLYGAFRFMNIVINRFERNSSTTKATQTEKEEHDKLIEIRKSIDGSINTALERVLMRTNADRAFIFEFHNGGANLAGLPFLKMSNTYEVVSVGVTPKRYSCEQMSLSMYSNLIGQIISNRYIVIDTSTKDERLQSICYETLLAQKIRSCILVRITDIKGKVLGYCGVDFIGKDKQVDESSDIKIIEELAIEVGALLTIEDK